MQTMENVMAERKQKLAAANKKLNTTALQDPRCHSPPVVVAFLSPSPYYHFSVVADFLSPSLLLSPRQRIVISCIAVFCRSYVANFSSAAVIAVFWMSYVENFSSAAVLAAPWSFSRSNSALTSSRRSAALCFHVFVSSFNRIKSIAVAYSFLAGWGDKPGAAE